MGNLHLIYGLIDPRTEEIRYIGKSTNGIRRPERHSRISEAQGHTHRERWLRELFSEGFRPEIVVLEEYEAPTDIDAVERQAIAHYRSMGFRLTNITDGGDGLSGYRFSEETRRKISASAIGRPKSAQHRASIAASRRGATLPEEVREKIRAAAKVRAAQPEERARLASLRTGMKNSQAARDKLRAANIGLKHNEARRQKNADARRGSKASAATRAKMSESHRQRWAVLRSKLDR